MAIYALSDNDVHALVSGQVIIDVLSVIKELVENALDANALSVQVILDNGSGATLESIVVRDDGTGIGVDDLSNACRRHCTSKISRFADIMRVRTLGFRGEALCSICATAELVRIESRTHMDPLGASAEYTPDGTVARLSHVSLPEGTVVHVKKPFSRLPVRREAMQRSAGRVVSRVKALLQTYAIAYEHVRFSLTSKSNKGTRIELSLPANASDDSLTRVAQVVGRELLDTHMFRQASTPGSPGLEIHAILATRQMQSQKLRSWPTASLGEVLVYIDGRPITTRRDVGRSISRAYHDCFSEARPFLCIKITMPEDSYDPNVEPSKDMVFLTDRDALLDAVRNFFADVYQDADPASPPASTIKVPREQTRNNRLSSRDVEAAPSVHTVDTQEHSAASRHDSVRPLEIPDPPQARGVAHSPLNQRAEPELASQEAITVESQPRQRLYHSPRDMPTGAFERFLDMPPQRLPSAAVPARRASPMPIMAPKRLRLDTQPPEAPGTKLVPGGIKQLLGARVSMGCTMGAVKQRQKALCALGASRSRRYTQALVDGKTVLEYELREDLLAFYVYKRGIADVNLQRAIDLEVALQNRNLQPGILRVAALPASEYPPRT